MGWGQRYVLRLSCRRARGEADVASETAFLRYLESVGIAVTVAVPTREGALFAYAQMPEGRRAVVLFRYIAGRAANWDDAADARLQGVALAQVHNAADLYAQRDEGAYRLDLAHLLHRPARAIGGIKGLSGESRAELGALEARLAAGILGLEGLSWTRCHGDCHGLNARISEAGKAVLFDFDDGGPGYLAYDLGVNLWARVFFNRKKHALWHAFAQGYNGVRPISDADFKALHVFAAIRHVWFLGEYAGRVAEWGSGSVSAAWFETEICNARAWEDEKLGAGLF